MLSLKYVAINSFNENIVYLHKDCSAYKIDNIKDVTKLEIHGGAEPLLAFLELVEDENIVSPDELGLNKSAFEQLNLPEGANVNGGAIAHGHALGNTGTRILSTLIYELKRRNKRYGLETLCIGGGQGVATVFEKC